MKKTEIISIALAAMFITAALSSCDKPAPEKPHAEGTPIVFTTEDNWNYTPELKAGSYEGPKISFSEGDRIGVYAYHTPSGSTVSNDFMADQMVQKTASGWVYSPLKYWPTADGDKIDFYAYYPYGNEGITYSDNGDGRYSIEYSMPDAGIDLLAAKTEGRTYAATAIPLNFKHLLVKVNLIFNWDESTTAFDSKVGKIVFKGVTSKASYSYKEDKWTLSEGSEVTRTFSAGVTPANGQKHNELVFYLLPDVIEGLILTVDDTEKSIDFAADDRIDLSESKGLEKNINLNITSTM